MSIGERLKKLRQEKGLTQAQLAEKLQCSHQSISCYENNKNLDRIYDFKAICDYFNVDINFLLTGKEYSAGKEISHKEQQILYAYHKLSESDKRIVNFVLGIGEKSIVQEKQPEYSDKVIQLVDKGDIILIDTYYMPVSAGHGNILVEDTPIQKPYQSTQISAKADFCVKVSGDSMEPYYFNGDFLFVQKTEEELQNKELGIFIYNEESVFKEYRNLNGYKALVSHNPAYSDKIIDNENKCITIGKVLGKYHID